MTDHITTHARSAHNYIHLAAAKVKRGETLTVEEFADVKLTQAYCDALLNGGSLEEADIYIQAFGGKAA